ncbi:MAG: GNAT family N-acetyltransferase [Ferruginibacter sp.]
MNIIFETSRLLLRQFTLADAGLLLQLNSDPEVLKYLHEPLLQDEAHAKEILTKIIFPQYEKGLGRWATFIKENNEFIGWCGLKYRPELDEIDLGYRFIKTAWGFGYATEAAAKTIEYGFNNLHVKIITGRAHIENIGSLKVLEKIGMKYVSEGIVDDCPVKTYIAVNDNNSEL